MNSISVSWSSGVQDEEAVQCLAAVAGAISSLYYTRWPWGVISPLVGMRTYGDWVIPALPSGSPYSSFDWYVASSAREDGESVDCERFLDLVAEEPWQHEGHHFDFSILDRSLVSGTPGEPVAFAARKGIAAVVSVDWVRRYGAASARRLVLRRVAAHAMGLAFGLDQHEANAPMCAMRPFQDADSLLSLAREEREANTIYCDDHYRDLLSILYSGREPLN